MSKASKAGQPSSAPRRLNLRALVVLVAVPLVAVPGFLALGYVQGRKNMPTYLDSARRALDKKEVGMALSYVNSYLQGDPRNPEALALRAQILADNARDAGAAQEAIRAQQLLLAVDPGRADARRRLIELNLKVGLFSAAQAAAKEYLKGRADDAEAHRLMAQALEGAGYQGDTRLLDEAVDEFEKAEKLKPGDVNGGARLAEIYAMRGRNPARALEVMDKVRDSNPKSVAARLARFHFFVRHPELASRGEEAPDARSAAERELDEARKLSPGDAEVAMLSAEDAVRKGKTTEARAYLAAISPPPKDDLRLNLIRGMIEFKEQRPDEAIQSWRAGLIQTGGSDAQLHWRLARVLIGLGRVGEARQHMEQYRRLVGGREPTPEYRYLDALIHLRAGRAKEALAELLAIRDRVPAASPLPASQLLIALGDAYSISRDEARALDTYAQAANAPGAGPQPWLATARLHQINDRPAEAITALERGLASSPKDPSLLVTLAQALRQRELDKPRDRRDWSEFNRRLAEAESVARDAPEVALLRAEERADAGDIAGAMARIEAAVERSPTSVAPWVARIQALARLGRTDEALKVIEEARKKAGDGAQFRVLQAEVLLRRGEPGPAYEALAGGMDRVPPDQRPTLWRALGEYHRGRRDLEAARRAFEEWARLQPEAVEPRVALLNLASIAGDAPAMEAQAEAIRRVVGPDSVLGKVARADALLALKPRSADGRSGEDKARLDEVARLAEEIKAAAPRQASGPMIEARLMERLGRADGEIAAYKAALERRGGQAALRPLVALLVRHGREAELEELRRRTPSFPAEVDQMLAGLLLQRGDAAGAEQLVDQMVQGNPQALDVAVWKAKVLNTLNKPDEAEKFLRELTLQQPEAADVWMQLLMFQASRGEGKKARETLAEMRRRLKPERPELLWAACYRALNMRAEADEELAKALEKYKGDPGVLQVAIDYFESTGRPEQAEPLLRQLLKDRPGMEWARRRLALNLSARPNAPAAMSEALALVGDPSPGESPDDRKLRAVVLSRSDDPRRRAEAVGILEAIIAEVPEAERAQLHEALARSLAASSEQARTTGDGARADAERARALEHAAKAAGGEKAPAQAILYYAALMLGGKDVAGARGQLARLEKSDPGALPTVELKARILHAEGKDAEAEALALAAFEARKAAPDALAAGLGLIRLLSELGRAEAAERLGSQLAAVGPRGRIAFAELLAGRGKAKEALEQLDAAAKAGGPAAAEAARASAALASVRGGDWVSHADGLLGLALKAQPDSIELLVSQAFVRHLRGDYKGELALYDEVLAKNPPSFVFLNNMAWTLSEELNRPEEGLKRIDEAIKRSGRQSHLVDTRGVILLRLGRVDEAIRELEDAAAMLPTAPIYFHLARAYRKKPGREADAQAYLDRARKAGLKAEQLQPSEREEAARLLAAAPAPAPAGGASRP